MNNHTNKSSDFNPNPRKTPPQNPATAPPPHQTGQFLDFLGDSESQYRMLVENLQEGMWIIDTELNFIFVNFAFCKITGCERDEIVGHNVREFVTEDAFRKILSEITKRKKGMAGRYELIVPRKDGSLRNTILSAAPWMNQQGQYQGSIGIILDETEQKMTEKALKESEERYRSLVDNIGLGVNLIDVNFNIVMTNPAQSLATNKSVSELLGKKCYKEFENRDDVCPFCPGIQAMKRGVPDEIETKRILKDGTCFDVRLKAFPIFGANHHIAGFIEVVEDITERKRMEDEIQEHFEARLIAERKQNEAAQLASQAAQLASIGVVAAGITHEINQPLSAIQMHANTLLYLIEERKYVLPEPFSRIFKEISQGVSRINSIIQHMRSYWLSTNSEPIEQIDLNQAVLSALTLTNRKALAHSIKIKTNLSSACINIEANTTQIEQIVINLVINAIHSLDEKPSPLREITISTALTEEEAILKVQDNGIGLPTDNHEHLFSPFFSTKRPGEGTGLGLAIVKMFVDRFNGTIEAAQNNEGGATFTVRFPLINKYNCK